MYLIRHTFLRYKTNILFLAFINRFDPNLTRNIVNKNFDRLALQYKIISQNSNIIPALFQLDYEDTSGL